MREMKDIILKPKEKFPIPCGNESKLTHWQSLEDQTLLIKWTWVFPLSYSSIFNKVGLACLGGVYWLTWNHLITLQFSTKGVISSLKIGRFYRMILLKYLSILGPLITPINGLNARCFLVYGTIFPLEIHGL